MYGRRLPVLFRMQDCPCIADAQILPLLEFFDKLRERLSSHWQVGEALSNAWVFR